MKIYGDKHIFENEKVDTKYINKCFGENLLKRNFELDDRFF